MSTGRAPSRNGGDISPQMHNDSDDDDMIFISNDGSIADRTGYSRSFQRAIASLDEERSSIHSDAKIDSETVKDSVITEETVIESATTPSSSGSIPSVTPPSQKANEVLNPAPHVVITIHEKEMKPDPELPSPRTQQMSHQAGQELKNRSSRNSLGLSSSVEVSDVEPASPKESGHFLCFSCDCLKHFSLFRKEKTDETEMKSIKNKPNSPRTMSL